MSIIIPPPAQMPPLILPPRQPHPAEVVWRGIQGAYVGGVLVALVLHVVGVF